MKRAVDSRRDDRLVLLDAIPFHPDARAAAGELRIDGAGDDFKLLRELLAQAAALGRPRAVYRACPVDARDAETVSVSGRVFRSRVLAVNLEKAERVFAYVATCGSELDDWAAGQRDPLAAWFADHAKAVALNAARKHLFGRIRAEYRLDGMSAMAPGSLPDWPLGEQKPLFELLGDVAGTAGVTLTGSFLMLPTKSVSGILFPTEIDFTSCMLCPRDNCPNRRAPYDPELHGRRYARR